MFQDKGYGPRIVKVDEVGRNLKTSAPDIFAIGDCAQQREPIGKRRAVEAVWYTGRMMGETVARTICGIPMEYRPGHWFNSAKFFDIEYQTYGWVSGTHGKDPEEQQWHWRHPDEHLCLTLSYHAESRMLLGMNAFGIRMRHEVIDRWLTDKLTIDQVLPRLGEANFDPEWYGRHEAAIRHAFSPKTQEIHD